MLKIIIPLVLASASALATSACPEVRGAVSDVIFTGEVNCSLAGDFSERLNDMQKIFGGPSLALIVVAASGNASYDEGHSMIVPIRPVFQGEYGQEYPVPVANVVTYASHEFGHAVLHEKIKKEFAKKFSVIFAEMDHVSDLNEQLNRGKSDGKAYNEAFIQLMSSADYQFFTEHFLPYSEFFADVLAVYIENDRSAIMNSLYYDQMKNEEYNALRLRDFAYVTDHSIDHLMDEAHTKLAYVRSYVGKNLWPKNDSEKRQYADKIYKAIVKVVKENMEKKEVPDVAEANKQLIDELKKP